MRVNNTKSRHEAIREYTLANPYESYREIAEHFGVGVKVVTRAMIPTGIDGRNRPSKKLTNVRGADRVGWDTFIVGGTRLTETTGKNAGRVFEVVEVEYLPNMDKVFHYRTVSSVLRPKKSSIMLKTLINQSRFRILPQEVTVIVEEYTNE